MLNSPMDLALARMLKIEEMVANQVSVDTRKTLSILFHKEAESLENAMVSKPASSAFLTLMSLAQRNEKIAKFLAENQMFHVSFTLDGIMKMHELESMIGELPANDRTQTEMIELSILKDMLNRVRHEAYR